MSFPYQKAAWTNIKNGLFSRRLTHSINWFSQENFRSRCFNWILRGKSQAELSKKGLQWQKNNWWKWFFTSNGLILGIVMSHRTNIFGFWLKVLNRVVITAFSASRWTTSVKTTFFGANHQFQFLLGFWGRRIWRFSEKKSQDCQDWIWSVRRQNWRKKCVFLKIFKITHLIGLWWKHIPKFGKKSVFGVLQTALYVSRRKIRTRWFSFESFNFEFFSRFWAENIKQCCQKLILCVQKNLWRMMF